MRVTLRERSLRVSFLRSGHGPCGIFLGPAEQGGDFCCALFNWCNDKRTGKAETTTGAPRVAAVHRGIRGDT